MAITPDAYSHVLPGMGTRRRRLWKTPSFSYRGASLSRNWQEGPDFFRSLLPSPRFAGKTPVSQVEPRGFDPTPSAVQSQSNVCRWLS
jgi:hypothetical protein